MFRKTVWRAQEILLSVCACIAISSCSNGEDRVVWSAKSVSPDGQVTATAYRDVPSGIGTGDFGTHVYLRLTLGSPSQSPTIVLNFEDGADQASGDKTVGMNWRNAQ